MRLVIMVAKYLTPATSVSVFLLCGLNTLSDFKTVLRLTIVNDVIQRKENVFLYSYFIYPDAVFYIGNKLFL